MLRAAARRKALEAMIPAVKTQKPEPWAEKMEKNSLRVRRGGGALSYNRAQTRARIGSRLSPYGKCRSMA